MRGDDNRCKVLGLPRCSAEARRFEAEIRILQTLNDAPGFPGYRYDGFTSCGERFVVYREVPGEPLRLPSEQAGALIYSQYLAGLGWLNITRRLLDQLISLHTRECRIFHGDISASNVIISRHGAIGVIDFGISRSRSLPRNLRFPSRQSVAAPRYMSPEQAKGRFWGSASDIYQVGLLALEVECGEPFGHGLTAGELLHRVRSDPGNACRSAMRRPGLAGQFLPALLAPDPHCRPSASRAFDALCRMA